MWRQSILLLTLFVCGALGLSLFKITSSSQTKFNAKWHEATPGVLRTHTSSTSTVAYAAKQLLLYWLITSIASAIKKNNQIFLGGVPVWNKCARNFKVFTETDFFKKEKKKRVSKKKKKKKKKCMFLPLVVWNVYAFLTA